MSAFEVAEEQRFGPSRRTPDLLIEVPHGATRRGELDELAGELHGPLPSGLEALFHVNTDEGAPEVAVEAAKRLAARGLGVVVLRCRLARTLVDANRVLAGAPAGMTSAMPDYVADPGDRRRLAAFHAEYTARAVAVYGAVCGAGGRALALHTYAPRAVEIAVDADAVGAIRRAYRPALYRRWPVRPAADLITEDDSGRRLAPARLAASVRERLGRIGFECGENRTYRLHAATMGCRHSTQWPGRVLTVELRRDLVGAPWRPFVESSIGSRKAARLGAALASALADGEKPREELR